MNNKTQICSPEFDNFFRGFKLSKGEHELDGREALGFSRVRTNPCAPGENDLDRAARQQEVLGGIKGKLFSPGSFVRLPWVSWKAPKARSAPTCAAPGLSGLAADVATGGVGDTNVLKPSCLSCGPAAACSSQTPRRPPRWIGSGALGGGSVHRPTGLSRIRPTAEEGGLVP